MKKLTSTALIVVSMAFLAGCKAVITADEVKWANEVCESNDGLAAITVWRRYTPDAHCNNGAKFISSK